MTRSERVAGSFRDPNGFLFSRNGFLFRQINKSYSGHFGKLIESGLYNRLVKAGLLISHQEMDVAPAEPDVAYKIIQPEIVPFISHPYEWCFSQLKDAALATLVINKRAINAGMVLKDASAYNMQFFRGKPVLIDTLSFETYESGKPWVAYRQFCQHFLAPLALMSIVDVRLNQLMRVHIDGIPLDLVSRLLPRSTYLNFGLLTHIHLHARAQKRYAGTEVKPINAGMNVNAMIGLIESLENTIRRLKWNHQQTEWGNYYNIANYDQSTFQQKRDRVREWVQASQPGVIWDLGANTGVFSREAACSGGNVISLDMDPLAVELNYHEVKEKKEVNILPLLMDLTNPSSNLGWDHSERQSLGDRGPADMVLALALIHHLAISNNVPMTQLAAFFASHAHKLIIEFVPKSDSQVMKLLASRQDIFPEYNKVGFENAFSRFFKILKTEELQGSERSLYLMEAIREL